MTLKRIWQAAWTLFLLAGEAAMAVAALDRALAHTPNAARAWLTRGNIHALGDQPEAAIEACEQARRLSPFNPYTFCLRRYPRCRSSRRTALRTSDRMGRLRLARPAAYGRGDPGQDRRQCPS